MSKVKPIPDGVPQVMPMLVCRDAAAEIDFCKTTFGAVELVRRPGPDGTVAHAALTIGGAMIMIEGEWRSLCGAGKLHCHLSSSLCCWICSESAWSFPCCPSW